MEMIGVYGAWKASLFYLITMEKMRYQAEDPFEEKILCVVSTHLMEIMHMFETEMAGNSEADKIFKFSTPKMLELLYIIKSFKDIKPTTRLCGIVFVQRRITAKIVYYVIKALSKHCSKFSHINADFLVGLSANISERDNVENLYANKISKRVMRSFKEGDINLLIASSVVEEGK